MLQLLFRWHPNDHLEHWRSPPWCSRQRRLLGEAGVGLPGGIEELGEVCRGQVPVAQGSAPVLKSKSLNRALGVSSRDFQFELGAESKECNGQSGRDGCISRSQGCCGEQTPHGEMHV